VDDVLENAFEPLYSSPVRPDPRPLHGVLLAVHAFLPIARLYEKMIGSKHALAESPAFRARYEEVVRINREGAEVVLANAKPTEVGRGLVDEIARWDDYFRRVG
jgi:HEXXH motif-containing protein